MDVVLRGGGVVAREIKQGVMKLRQERKPIGCEIVGQCEQILKRGGDWTL